MKRVLAVVAHPDDIEFLMAGTLIRLKNAGLEIHYWNLANGCFGSVQTDREETARIREQESMDSCKRLGAIFHPSICDDLSVFYNRETLASVASKIREIQPSIILTHSLEDYMEDHTNTARLVVTGAFSRAMKHFVVTPPQPSTQQNVCLYHAQPYSNLTPMQKLVVPDIFVDTESLIPNKKELLSCHKSQKDWLDQSQGLDSYLETIGRLDGEVGEMSGRFKFAEGWRQHLHLGFGGDEENFLVSELRHSDQQMHVMLED